MKIPACARGYLRVPSPLLTEPLWIPAFVLTDQQEGTQERVPSAEVRAQRFTKLLFRCRRSQPLMAFLRGTGARFGEVTALLGRDFALDVEQPTVRIEKAWKRDEDDRFYVGPPKTKKSRRSISMPPSLVNMLRPHVEDAGPDGLVFTTTYGGRSGTPPSTNFGRRR